VITVTNVVDGQVIPQKKFYFPSGEMQINLDLMEYATYPVSSVDIKWKFEKNEDLIELLMIGEILQRNSIQLINLIIEYMPYSPQDRANEPGECFSLQVSAAVVNSMKAQKVNIKDPHSDVTCGLVAKSFPIPQEQLIRGEIKTKRGFWLVSPDGGALKKIYKVAESFRNNELLGLIQCTKHRDLKTGKITHTEVHGPKDLQGKDVVIADDICWGGASVNAIAEELELCNAGKLILFVSHGFFTRGLDAMDRFDEIYTKDGRVK
jgi:ribose-phosphate pyrophosphokinase